MVPLTPDESRGCGHSRDGDRSCSGCFLGTDLDLVLRGLGVQTLLVTGVDSNVCVLWTTGDGFQLDYHVRVLEDCTAGTTPRRARGGPAHHPRANDGQAGLLRRGHLGTRRRESAG
jgi:Isochorismatase family